MKEALQGRRLGFALRPQLGLLALGLAIALLVCDLASWFAWGTTQTNAFVWAAYWFSLGAAILGLLSCITGLAELRDVPEEERALGRVDLALTVLASLALVASAALRSVDLGAAGASPAALLTGAFGTLALLVGAVMAGSLYAPREWEEIIEERPRERHPKRRASAR